MKLALGGAQFGMSYGISNKKGQITLHETEYILNTAQKNNIRIIDTSPAYGKSEKILGKIINKNNAYNFKIITKTPYFMVNKISKKEIIKLTDSIKKSFNNLNVQKIYGVIFHNTNDVFTNNGELLYKTLNELKNKNLINKIGFSVYTKKQIDLLLNYFKFDLIQLPISILDQRLLYNDYLKILKKHNIEIHARSIFLQGLLLMNPTDIPDYFKQIKNKLKIYHKHLKELNITPIESALSFAKNINEIDYIIMGINNNNQLQENINAYNKKIAKIKFDDFACLDEKFINPTNWVL